MINQINNALTTIRIAEYYQIVWHEEFCFWSKC